MMLVLLQNWSVSNVLLSYSSSHGYKISRDFCHIFFRRNTKKTFISCFSSSSSAGAHQVVEILQNKVLIAAAASAAIGQISKPFTSIMLGRNSSFDFKATFQSGGFPSSHSSVTVATATTLGVERGFSDPIFGLAVVYACLIMYDAQGVRREVGNHAKALNRAFSVHKSDDRNESIASTKTSFEVPIVRRKSESDGFFYTDLKESVGHTEIEVVAGALLGFFVSLAVCTI